MTVANDVLVYANIVSAAVALGAIGRALVRGRLDRRFMRGRYISRPTIRRLGLVRALALRLVVLVSLALVMALVVEGVARQADPVGHVLALWWNLWIIDDWLFDERKPRRKHEWARVRLRMPKPVKLRPAERWAPSPA